MKIFRNLAALALFCVWAPAHAQVSNAVVVSTCGTPPAIYTAGANRQITQDTTGTLCTPGASGVPSTVTPLYSVPVAYTSGTVFNGLAYGSVIFTCTVAPSAGTISVSPDNNSDFILQTAVLNNASGINTVANINATGVYTISGHQYVQAILTGGTCFISGGQ